MRVLYITPHPNARNGISKYAVIYRNSMVENYNLDFDTVFMEEKKYSLKEVKACVEKIDMQSFDLIHAEIGVGTNSTFYLLALLALKNKNIKILVTLHDPPLFLFSPTLVFYKHSTKGILNKVCRKCTDAIFNVTLLPIIVRRFKNYIVLNKGAVPILHKKYKNITVEYIPLIAYSADKALKFAKSNQCNKTKYNVLFYGFVAKSKGLEILLEAIQLLLNKNIKINLKVVGGFLSESYRKYIDEEINQRGLSQNVYIYGYVPEDKLNAVFNECGILVLPYFATGLCSGSASIIEGMQRGMAVVVSDINRFKLEFNDGEDVLMFKSGNAIDLADKLELLLKDEQLFCKLAANARKRIETLHSQKMFAVNFMRFIRC